MKTARDLLQEVNEVGDLRIHSALSLPPNLNDPTPAEDAMGVDAVFTVPAGNAEAICNILIQHDLYPSSRRGMLQNQLVYKSSVRAYQAKRVIQAIEDNVVSHHAD